jgi:hypothetical protein
MKTTFKFYFLMIIGTALLSSVFYGLAERLVEKNITACSFALMVVTVISLTGMMRTLVPVPATRQ